MCLKLNSKMFIAFMKNNDKKSLKGKKTFGDFNVRKDLNYAGDDEIEHNLDILYPAMNPNGITLLYIHGGSYIYGFKEASRIYCSYFVSKGFKVIAMNYRLGNHKNHIGIVEQVQDVFKALDFLKENEKEFDIDFNRFALLGDSAGGHLSLITNIIFNSKEAQKFFGISKLPDIDIKCLGLDSPMYDSQRLIDGGKGLNGVTEKHQDYYNPFIDLMLKGERP